MSKQISGQMSIFDYMEQKTGIITMFGEEWHPLSEKPETPVM